MTRAAISSQQCVPQLNFMNNSESKLRQYIFNVSSSSYFWHVFKVQNVRRTNCCHRELLIQDYTSQENSKEGHEVSGEPIQSSVLLGNNIIPEILNEAIRTGKYYGMYVNVMSGKTYHNSIQAI